MNQPAMCVRVKRGRRAAETFTVTLARRSLARRRADTSHGYVEDAKKRRSEAAVRIRRRRPPAGFRDFANRKCKQHVIRSWLHL